MGLDVTAYAKIQLRPGQVVPTTGTVYLGGNEREFAARAADVPRGYYEAERGVHVYGRPYTSYNNWREQLARLAGYAPHAEERDLRHSRSAWEAAEGPFWELINFTDCDGVLGTAVCRKLLSDFERFAAQAVNHVDPEFGAVYRLFHDAIRIGSNDGAVMFA